MKTDYETITVEMRGPHLMLLTLNRPQARNALNTQMGKDLRDIFVPLRFTPGDLRCVVLTGKGEQAFCAGGDLKERNGMTDEQWRLQHAIFEEGFYAVMDCSVPVIAAVNGSAYGGGCELSLACDFIYASSTAKFALPETTLGIMPGGGGTQNLPRAIGQRRATELLITGRSFTAAQAERWGMVNEVLEPDRLLTEVLGIAQNICDNAPLSVRQAKKSVRYGMQTDIGTALVFEVQAYERMISTADRREGVRAFNEKRKPKYLGQ